MSIRDAATTPGVAGADRSDQPIGARKDKIMGWYDRSKRGEISFTPAETARLDQLGMEQARASRDSMRDFYRAKDAEKRGTRQEAKEAAEIARTSKQKFQQARDEDQTIRRQADGRTQRNRRG